MSRTKELTRESLLAICENPEQASLRCSPQVLLEFWDGHWVRPDGAIVRMTALIQNEDGTLVPVLETTPSALMDDGK